MRNLCGSNRMSSTRTGDAAMTHSEKGRCGVLCRRHKAGGEWVRAKMLTKSVSTNVKLALCHALLSIPIYAANSNSARFASHASPVASRSMQA